MLNCGKCKKSKELNSFIDKKEKQHKTCFNCREKCRLWRENNKDTVSLYNKNYNEKKADNTEITVVYARKAKTNEAWQKFDSQLDLAKKLNLLAPNINKVVKGELRTTGGYEIKLEKEIYKGNVQEWSDIKEENNIVDKVKSQPSIKRILHEKVNDILGKNYDLHGCIIEYESPYMKEVMVNGQPTLEVPVGLYYIRHDPYATDKDGVEITSQDSLGAAYVYERTNGITKSKGEYSLKHK